MTQPRSTLRLADVWGTALGGLRGRPVRTALSAAGVALGVATMVSVLGISSSSRAQLLAQIDALGTNLLTVTPGQGFGPGPPPPLPVTAPAMIRRIGPVLATSAIGIVGNDVNVYRSDRISPANTNAIAVGAAETSLLATLQGHMASGRFLDALSARFPVAVLGAQAAAALGIDRLYPTTQIWLGSQWFAVGGIMDPLVLAPELDRSVLIGFPIAHQLFGATNAPSQIYVRADPADMGPVQAVLAATADPATPQNVTVADPADALVARADAGSAFSGLFFALGAVGLVVGGIGIVNVMFLAVLERRAEIGLRRALGASRRHVGAEFLAESTLLAGLGGVSGAVLGVFATALYAALRHWHSTVPLPVLGGAVLAAMVVGAVAGLYPAIRAARLSPAEALRTV